MTLIDNEMLWRQFRAAIDSLSNALREPIVAQNYSATWNSAAASARKSLVP